MNKLLRTAAAHDVSEGRKEAGDRTLKDLKNLVAQDLGFPREVMNPETMEAFSTWQKERTVRQDTDWWCPTKDHIRDATTRLLGPPDEVEKGWCLANVVGKMDSITTGHLDMKATIQGYKAEVAKKSQDLVNAGEKHDKLYGALRGCRARIGELKTQRDDSKISLQDVEDRLRNLEQARLHEQKQAAAASQENQTIIQGLTEELEAAKEALERSHRDNPSVDLASQLNDADVEIASRQYDIQKLQQQCKDLEEEKATLLENAKRALEDKETGDLERGAFVVAKGEEIAGLCTQFQRTLISTLAHSTTGRAIVGGDLGAIRHMVGLPVTPVYKHQVSLRDGYPRSFDNFQYFQLDNTPWSVAHCVKIVIETTTPKATEIIWLEKHLRSLLSSEPSLVEIVATWLVNFLPLSLWESIETSLALSILTSITCHYHWMVPFERLRSHITHHWAISAHWTRAAACRFVRAMTQMNDEADLAGLPQSLIFYVENIPDIQETLFDAMISHVADPEVKLFKRQHGDVTALVIHSCNHLVVCFRLDERTVMYEDYPRLTLCDDNDHMLLLADDKEAGVVVDIRKTSSDVLGKYLVEYHVTACLSGAFKTIARR